MQPSFSKAERIKLSPALEYSYCDFTRDYSSVHRLKSLVNSVEAIDCYKSIILHSRSTDIFDGGMSAWYRCTYICATNARYSWFVKMEARDKDGLLLIGRMTKEHGARKNKEISHLDCQGLRVSG